MKKFYVAFCCTLLLSGSWVMAQDELAEERLSAAAKQSQPAAQLLGQPAAQPLDQPVAQAQGNVISGEAAPLYTEGSFGTASAEGCSSCGSSLPQTFTSAPAVIQGCSACDSGIVSAPIMPATFTSAPIAQDACCQAACAGQRTA